MGQLGWLQIGTAGRATPRGKWNRGQALRAIPLGRRLLLSHPIHGFNDQKDHERDEVTE